MRLREVAIEKAKRQPKQVDYLLEASPVLDTIQFYESSNGLRHVVDRLIEVTGASWLKLDQPLPTATTTSALDWVELGMMGFKMFVGEDKLKELNGGNFPAYIARKLPMHMKKTGMDTENALFKLFLQYALQNKHVIDCGATGSGSGNIFIVRWVQEEFCGLYNPDGFGQGALFDTEYLNNGALHEDPTTHVNGYAARFKSNLGFLMENPNCISALVNIDDTKIPAAKQIDQALRMARAGDGGNTWIVGDHGVLDLLGEIKGNKLHMSVTDTNYSQSITAWNGTPLKGTYNAPSNTTKVVVQLD